MASHLAFLCLSLKEWLGTTRKWTLTFRTFLKLTWMCRAWVRNGIFLSVLPLNPWLFLYKRRQQNIALRLII